MKKMQHKFISLLRTTARLIVGGAVGWFSVSGLVNANGSGSGHHGSFGSAIAMFMLALFVCTAVHELGHWAASRLVGFRLALLSVGPISIARGPRGWRMGLGRGLGQCLAYPTDTRDLRRRNLVYFSGGVGCGFGFALICGMVVRFGGLHSGYLTEFLGWCFWIALSLNALSLVPDGMGSDGFCLNIMRKGGPKADQLIAAFTAQIHDLLGIRYRDMDRVLSDALTQPACTPVWQLMGQNTAYFVAMDAGRIDEARPLLEHLRELAEETPSLPNVELELAYFAAVHEKNPVEARRHYEAADGEGSPFARATAEAAILIEEGQSEAALSVLDTIQDQVTAARSSGTAMMQHAVDCFEGLNLRAGGSVSSAAVRPVTVEN